MNVFSSVSVTESESTLTSVAQVTATDFDSSLNDYNVIKYTIDGKCWVYKIYFSSY